jgi:predicted oxidoreductase
MPDTVTISPNELRSLVKAAVTEAFQEQRAAMHDMVDEEIEEIGLAKAMDEADITGRVSREEIFGILKSQQ